MATSDSNTNYWAGVFGPLSAGTHNYTIQVTDSAGTTTSYTGSFNVVAAVQSEVPLGKGSINTDVLDLVFASSQDNGKQEWSIR